MFKKTILVAMLAASALVSFPQAASADGCELNCFWTTVYNEDGHAVGGFWTCSGIYMDCVE